MHLVLASGSRYRARLLAEAGHVAVTDPPEVDERALDHLFAEAGPEVLAVTLAEAKARAVAPRHPGAVVVAADQVGSVDTDGGPIQLTKRGTREGAVTQLVALSGTTHRLVNGLAVLDVAADRLVTGVDVQLVTFRDLDRGEAAAYVDRFEPWDTSGSYRLEDQEAMGPGEGFVVAVEGEDPSGVLGLPLPLLGRLLDELSR